MLPPLADTEYINIVEYLRETDSSGAHTIASPARLVHPPKRRIRPPPLPFTVVDYILMR
jgi:hypothetical protein